ncbi:MAG: S-layer homology domain-containing protein [Selenomonas sp.]|nr:S-layer homology domain-containing protein [Selenomonas sp.]
MKKTLVSALTTALVVGAASTTFAAANPFSDVPADHWAYDAVSQLAADGVIEGYGDSTFRGDRNITRYEMAQMVARAMAKNDVSAADKAMIDKLAAEFADELNSLGVRVANLERNADMVKWNGKLEYTYTHDKWKVNGNKLDAVKDNNLLFRLEPSAEVNDHWHVNARIDGNYKMDGDEQNKFAGGNDSDFRLKRAWAQGDYKLFSVRFGKFSMYGDTDINDTTMSGADITIGNKNKLSGVIGGGRSQNAFDDNGTLYDLTNDRLNAAYNTTNVNYVGNWNASNVFYAGIDYNRNENKGFFGGLRYFRFSNPDIFIDDNGDKEKNNIFQVNAGYKFDKNSTLRGLYAHSSVDRVAGWGRVASGDKKAYNIEFDYKGAQKENKGTWGAWLAYRHLGLLATPAATWDVTSEGLKGWAIGANYTFLKNIVGTVQYGDNKVIGANDVKVKQFFGRVEWFF